MKRIGIQDQDPEMKIQNGSWSGDRVAAGGNPLESAGKDHLGSAGEEHLEPATGNPLGPAGERHLESATGNRLELTGGNHLDPADDPKHGVNLSLRGEILPKLPNPGVHLGL